MLSDQSLTIGRTNTFHWQVSRIETNLALCSFFEIPSFSILWEDFTVTSGESSGRWGSRNRFQRHICVKLACEQRKVVGVGGAQDQIRDGIQESFFLKQRHDACSKVEETRVLTCFQGRYLWKWKNQISWAGSIASGSWQGKRRWV